MNPEQWQQMKTVFHAARALPPRERVAYAREACAGNEEMYAEVAAMLELDEAQDEFMQQPLLAETRFGSLLKVSEGLSSGHRIGPYEIERKIGEGGMGQVYRARDVRLGRLVAIKVLRKSFTREAERVKRFQQEARAASALNHPNILTIYEVDREDGLDFMATEFIEGQTLRELLKTDSLTLGAVLDVILQVGQALEASHRVGIIHRDIKPENVMQRADGYVKVLDFGLAKLTERQDHASFIGNAFSHFTTRPGVVMGTVTYMSPEQARGNEVDARSDVFSLGVVLYEMLTGRVPFEGATTSDVIAALLEREPKPLDSYLSGLPAAFQSIVARALQKRLDDRYASVTEMLADLRALKDELEVTAKLKRLGKARVADTSWLEMRVGHSQGQPRRSTNERQGRSTTRFSTAVVWMKSRPLAALASMLLLALTGFAAQAWYAGKLNFAGSKTGRIDSIAVLPFADQTNDAQLAYLPDGLTESLINSLSQLPALTVMARSTVFTYKGKEVDPRAVGEALKVKAVVLGHVARQGEQMTIKVELVDAATGARLWGRNYQPAPSGVLSVNDELTRELGDVLRPQLSRAERQQFTKPATSDNDVWQLYLRGKHLLRLGTVTGYQKALEYFKEAVARDPRFALGHAGVSDAYSILSAQLLPPSEAIPKAREAVLTALQLDDSLPEAHSALARIKWWHDWDWAGADHEFQRAIQLNPNLAEVHQTYIGMLTQRGRLAEAETEIRRVEVLDPQSLQPGILRGGIHYYSRRYDAAVAKYREALELFPNNEGLLRHLALALSHQGEHLEAVNAARQSVTLDTALTYRAWLAYVLARAGQRAEALTLLREFQRRATRERISPIYFARIYLGLGDHKQALQWLRNTYNERSDHILNIGVDPVFDPLRADPGFQEILRGVGLAQ